MSQKNGNGLEAKATGRIRGALVLSRITFKYRNKHNLYNKRKNRNLPSVLFFMVNLL